MKNTIKILIIIAASSFLFINEAIAQSVQLTGLILDELGEPLPGVAVKIQDSPEYVTTDNEGKFQINTDKIDGNLTCSFLGYKNRVYPLDFTSEMTIRMQPDISNKDEMMDVALNRKESRLSYTGAMSTIRSNEIEMWQSTGLDETLKGKLAGYHNGHIRGLNSTNGEAILIVLDGVPAPTVELSSIDPRTVESVSILKDASAKALYGPLAAQGVIMVTTKKGMPGKTKVNVNLNYAIEKPTIKAEMLNSYDYALLRNQALTNDGLSVLYTQKDLDSFANGTGIDNDWRKMFLNDWRSSQRYNIELTGGNDRMNYYVNAGYARTEGMYKVDWKDKYNPSNHDNRFTLASNINVNISKFISTFLNTNVRIYRVNDTGGSSIINKIYSTPNTIEGPLSEDGKIITNENFPNPIYGSINYSGVNIQTATDVNVSLGLNLDLSFLLKGLSIKGIVGYHSYYAGNRKGSYNYSRYVRDEKGELVLLGTNIETALSWSKSSSTVYFMNFQGMLEYNARFGLNSIDVLLNYLAEDKLGNSYSSGWLLPFRRIQFGGHAKYGYNEIGRAHV